jgi:GR25 family glycosyltransferase involved in LPS biosynthesis
MDSFSVIFSILYSKISFFIDFRFVKTMLRMETFHNAGNVVHAAGVDALQLEKNCDKNLLLNYKEYFQKQVKEDKTSGISSSADFELEEKCSEQVTDYWDCYLQYQMNSANSQNDSSTGGIKTQQDLSKYQVMMTKCEKAYILSHLKIWKLLVDPHQPKKNQQGSSSGKNRVPQKEFETLEEKFSSQLLLNQPFSSSVLPLFDRYHQFHSLPTSDSDGSSYLIMKDDLIINIKLFATHPSSMNITISNYLNQIIPCLPDNWDILFLGGEFPPKKTQLSSASSSTSVYQFTETSTKKYFYKVNYVNKIYAYLISSRGMTKILTQFLPIDKPFDHFIGSLLFEEEINVRRTFPFCVVF